jgi:lipopolysaccharide/colanic/teichoic acid biosynthesis glycosyltransferase
MYVYRRKLYTAVQFVLDTISFWFIWQSATALRILLNPFTKRQLSWDNASIWVPSMALVLLLWIAISARLRLYRVPDEIRLTSIAQWAGKNVLALCILSVLAAFFSHQFGEGASRLFVLCLVPAAFVVFVATRSAALRLIAAFQRRWQPPRIVVIGDSHHARLLVKSLEPRVAKAIRGLIVSDPTGASTREDRNLPVLGTTRQLAELVNKERIDHAIIMTRSLPNAEIEHCKRVFWRMGLPMSYALDLPPNLRWAGDGLRLHSRLELSRQYGLHTVEVRRVAFTKAQDFVKRAFDLLLASVVLVVLGPAMLVIALLMKIKSKGPVLEKSLHVGKGGRHFNCIKFRTTQVDDPSRITGIGRFLLRYRSDELPQLANILRGRMSFVGPAPLAVENADTSTLRHDAIIWWEARSLVQPGLTGLWQTSRDSLSFDEMMQLDVEYIQSRSLCLYISILLGTPLAVIRGTRIPEIPYSAVELVSRASAS